MTAAINPPVVGTLLDPGVMAYVFDAYAAATWDVECALGQSADIES